MSEASNRAQAKYDAAHTKQIRLKLNKETDADILKRLDEIGNKQGYIKELIRADMEIVRCGVCKHRKIRCGIVVCEYDSLDPFEQSRQAENDEWFCADGER